MPDCEICGDPMPEGEEMFKYHGYSGPCPKPPKPRTKPAVVITDKMLSIAAEVLRSHGIDISCPWDGTLDDLENERFMAMRAAIEAVLIEQQDNPQ